MADIIADLKMFTSDCETIHLQMYTMIMLEDLLEDASSYHKPIVRRISKEIVRHSISQSCILAKRRSIQYMRVNISCYLVASCFSYSSSK